jgi:hypothetical protein
MREGRRSEDGMAEERWKKKRWREGGVEREERKERV